MQATKQQQIVVYFIEEAKEHLDTIEQGLLDLQATMEDTERLNELFRAAHSVKGGAAMLGFSAIQKVGHHLEDGFKLLKENPVRVDQQLENLFLQGFDVLKHLVTELQSPYGLQEHEAKSALQTAEPMFVELEVYLNRLIRGAAAQPAAAKVPANLAAVINAVLKKMLEIFKQGDTPAGRQQLAALCAKIIQLHSSAEWRGLIQAAVKAIANPKAPYKVLAPLLIKELKQAGDLLLAGRAGSIAPSSSLQQLAGVPAKAVPQPTAPQPLPVAVAAATAATQPPVNVTAPAAAPAQKSGKVQQITIPAEPRAAARALLEAFNKNQLIELAEYLMKAIQ